MDTQTILQMFKQAVKGGRGPEDEAYTAQRRESMGFQPEGPTESQMQRLRDDRYREDRRNSMRPIMNYSEEPKQLADQFAPQQVGTQRVGTQRDWSNNPHTRTDWGPELPMNGVPISAEEFGLADQFAPQGARPMGFPGVDDMRRNRGSKWYIDHPVAERDIINRSDSSIDYGYEGPDTYPQDVVDRVLMEEQARRKYRTMPGSPVNY